MFFKKSFIFDQNVESDWWRWESLHFLPLCLIIIFLFDTRASPFFPSTGGRFDFRMKKRRRPRLIDRPVDLIDEAACFVHEPLSSFSPPPSSFVFRRQIASAVHVKMRSGADNEEGWSVLIGRKQAT